MSNKPRGATSSTLRTNLSNAWRAARPPLPGLAELEEATRKWVGSMKTQGYDNEQCQSLLNRIDDLLSAVQNGPDESRSPEAADMIKQLYDIGRKFEEECKSQRQRGVLGAERRRRMIDSLNEKLDRVVESHLVGAMHKLIQNQSRRNEKQGVDNFPLILTHDITNRTIIRPASTPSMVLSSKLLPVPKLSLVDNSVVKCTWRGQLGKLSVIYRSYRSHSDGYAATKAAERELKHLSSCLHPNVASIIGITKGYYGLNGYLVEEPGVSIVHFLSMVNQGAVFARCLRDIDVG